MQTTMMMLWLVSALPTIAAIPATPRNFTQRIDHFTTTSNYFQQRYYLNSTSFRGPGSPMLVALSLSVAFAAPALNASIAKKVPIVFLTEAG